jgi:short-subunit dehydrogenase
VYTSTKHAVVAFSEALHYEVEPHGLLVTAVNPGLVATEAFPHREAIEHGRRVMQPDAVARVILQVIEREIAPERSIPRWVASLQAFRVLTPPLYRFGLRHVARRRAQSTRAGQPQ